MNELDRLLEEAWRAGGGDRDGRKLLTGYVNDLSDLESEVAEVAAIIKAARRDMQVDFGDLCPTEEAAGDYLFRCIHAARTEVQNTKVAFLAWYTDKRGGL